MRTTKDYLKLSPWEALIAMINDKNNLVLMPETTKLLEIDAHAGTTTEVTLQVRRGGVWGLLPLVGVQSFTYERLDLSTYFSNDLPIAVEALTYPTTTLSLVEWLTQHYEIMFDRDDFIHEELLIPPDTTYTLKASPYSLRWIGELVFTLPKSDATPSVVDTDVVV